MFLLFCPMNTEIMTQSTKDTTPGGILGNSWWGLVGLCRAM